LSADSEPLRAADTEPLQGAGAEPLQGAGAEPLRAADAEPLQGAGAEPLRSVLIAGVGNAWMRDDGFGGTVARRLAQLALPHGVTVMDAGTGGLDLAYEVMRGYDALVLVDVSRRGGEPGTLYVIDVDESTVAPSIEDGETLDPHGMDPRTVLRFVRGAGAWPGRVVVIACEPADAERAGWGLSGAVSDAVERAAALVLETVAQLRALPDPA